ncbi:protein ref(2)P [Anopheles marshallii]|uniref:protein ref(2)P n=1 Tax=Anopheles marshallii TaxID=1521116 RepID=UPI00237AD208|nr:protein ref(2)P [Anopheles marshallii]
MSDLVSLKITIENDANYLLFGSRICRDIKELAAFCRNRYQDLQKNVDDFLYYWIDDDGDAIRITTDEDYQSFLLAMANVKARLYVAAKNAAVAETSLIKEEFTVQAELDDAPMLNDATGDAVSSRPVHQHAICDVCDGQIVGHRYKCLTCHDYDLCMGCEAKFRHKDHLMLRIPKPVMVNRSQSTVSRMLDKLRVYSARIASSVERDLGPEGEANAATGNESAEINGTKRANARSVHRSKHSDERRTTETSKSSRGGKLCGNDRKHNSAAETSGERCSQDTKEKPSVPTASDYMQNCRDMMYMYLNSVEALDTAGKSAPWTTSDHVAVANVAAATAAAAAARATALANKVMKVNVANKNGKSIPSQEKIQPSQRVGQMTAPTQQKPATNTEEQPSGGPPAPSVIPLPFLPFVNLTWPTQEKLLVASENVSKLLDPLGLSFEIRHKSSGSPSTSPGCAKARGSEDGGAVPSTSAFVADTTSPIPTTSTMEPNVQQERNKPTETQVSPEVVESTSNAITQMQSTSPEAPVCEVAKENLAETEMVSSGAKEQITKAEKTISTTLETDSAFEKKSETGDRNEVDDEDDSQNTSSASLLTDDDQDLLEVAVDEQKTSEPPVTKEKSWTLIDLPQEHDDEDKVANAPLDAIAKLIGRDLSSHDKELSQPLVASKEKKKDKTGDQPKKRATFISPVVERHSSNEMLRKLKSGEFCDIPQPEPLFASEEMKYVSSSSPNSGPSSSSSSGSASGSRSGKSSRKSNSAQQKDTTIYSHRPHVNHAIHTMMTMGFSNHNGWLTQLLESLNGDIPKALDLLLQHRH